MFGFFPKLLVDEDEVEIGRVDSSLCVISLARSARLVADCCERAERVLARWSCLAGAHSNTVIEALNAHFPYLASDLCRQFE